LRKWERAGQTGSDVPFSVIRFAVRNMRASEAASQGSQSSDAAAFSGDPVSCPERANCKQRSSASMLWAAAMAGALFRSRFPPIFLAIQRRSGNVSEQNQAIVIYTTYPSIVEAETAGRALVERRLCACVNILAGMVSFYWWQGKVERGDEAVMIIKTRASLAAAVRAAVKQMHSYTTPAILVIPIDDVDPDYHAWIIAETTKPTLSTG
jgi:periplasmic divalent cation tolerance protein